MLNLDNKIEDLIELFKNNNSEIQINSIKLIFKLFNFNYDKNKAYLEDIKQLSNSNFNEEIKIYCLKILI